MTIVNVKSFLWLGCLSISKMGNAAENGRCQDPENHPVCLLGGSNAAEGNVFVDGLPVCDDKWDDMDADVVCKQLGYTRGALEATEESQFGQVGVTFSLDDVACTGNEDKIKNCPHEKRDDCGVQEGAGVVCDAITKEEEDKDQEMTENCFAKNVGYKSGGVMSGPKKVSSAMHCQRWCRDNEDCVHFSFHSITKVCQRYSVISANDKIKRDSVVSGPRECLLNMTIALDNCKKLSNETICLVNPNNLTNSGNVFVNGQPVCDDNWSMEDGRDVCKQMGYHGIRKVTKMSYFGLVPATFVHFTDENAEDNEDDEEYDYYDYVNYEDNNDDLGVVCDSSEGAGVICDTREEISIDRERECFIESLTYSEENKLDVETNAEYADDCQSNCTENKDCTHFTWFPNDNKCTLFNRTEMDGEKLGHPQAISGPRVCSDDPHIEFDPIENCNEEESICLVGGASNNEGNVFVGGKPVCDDGWNILNAHVACKYKGFVRAVEATTNSRFGNVGQVFGLDDVQCSGEEEKLSECKHSSTEDCEGFEAAGVICDTRNEDEIAKTDHDLSEKCFARNVVYGDLLTDELVYTPTAADCQHYCQQHSQCQTFSYNNSTKECNRRKSMEDIDTDGIGECITTSSRLDKEGNPSKAHTKCIFPFTFRGKTYYSCAPGNVASNIPEDSFWCSTKVDQNEDHISGQGEWGYCNQACSVKLWRDDGRCGESHPLPNGEPGQCDPTANANEKGPCCSYLGWCGNSDAHCKCSSCVNYADCSCSDFINEHGFGQCKKESETFAGSVTCYVNKPSTCTDLVESQTNPGKFYSAEACKHKSGNCPTGWTSLTTGCYKLTNRGTQQQAAANCRSEGAFLAEIDNEEEHNAVTSFTQEKIWLGATDTAKEGEWIWSYSGKKITFNNWFRGEPNGGTRENCLEGNSHGGSSWNDKSCSRGNFRGLCELGRINEGVASLSTVNGNSTVSNCVDGNLNTLCHSPYNERYPFFVMEYPKPVLIKQVSIVVAGSSVKQLVVSVTSISPVQGELVSESGGSTILGKFPGPAHDGQVIMFTSEGGIRGRYVVVQQENIGTLYLAEVQITTESYLSHFSVKGKEIDGSTSNIISGPRYCPSGSPALASKQCEEPGSVCLVNGTSPFEGNIYLGGKPICDDQWNLNSGRIVCKQLGFGLAKDITLKSQFGDVQGPFSMGNVECLGTEERVTDCVHNQSPQCLGEEAAGVICESDNERLVREEEERTINECFIEETCYYSGYDSDSDYSDRYANRKVSSVKECQEHCEYTDRCTHFSYDKDTWHCFFFNTGHIKAPCSNIISGPKSCDKVELEIKISEDDPCRKEGQLCLWSKETGKMSSRGNVFVGGEPVCDDSWGLVDGEVVCRQLQFHGVREVTARSHFGFVSGTFSMDDVECTGAENNITECPYEKRDNCEGGEAAGVVCDTRDKDVIEEERKKIKNCFMEDIEIGGVSLVSYDNVTYVLNCHEKCENEPNCTHFTFNTESHACTLYEGQQQGKGKKPSFGSYSGPKSCKDNSDIIEVNDNQDNSTDADICLKAKNGTTGKQEGNVFWDKKPVCDDDWDFVNANVVCRQLGFSHALEFKTESFFGEVSMTFSLDDVICHGNETSLADCTHATNENCDGSEAAGVICDMKNETDIVLNDKILACFAENVTMGPILPVHRGTKQVQYVYLPSSTDCQKLCQYNKLCGFFSFEKASQKCYLRKDVYEKYEEEGFVSGPKECVNNTVELNNNKGDNCSQPGVACLGGGTGYHEGNVYIEGNPICDEIGSWGMTNSHVLCKQMGYPRAKQFKTNSYFGNVTGPFFATSVRCIGNEKSLEDCEFVPKANCLKMEAVGVVCQTHSERFQEWVTEQESYTYTCLEMETNYIGADKPNETIHGHGEKKDTVGDCQDSCQKHPECHYFTYFAEKNVCRMLRMKGESQHGMPHHISGPKNCHPCTKFDEFGKCEKYIEDGCFEKGAICLVGGSNATEGNVLVGGKPVCDDGWDKRDAEVVCKQLGFMEALNATDKSTFGRVSIDFGMDEVTCIGSEDELTDCKHESDDHDCNHDEGAGVVCQPNHDGSDCFKEHVIHDASVLRTEEDHFKPENVLKDDCDNFNANAPSKTNYWLSPSRQTGGFLIIDLGCSMIVDKITFKNTHNGKQNDRGLANFTISLSNSTDGLWHAVLKDQLKDVRNLGCSVPLEIFSLTDRGEQERTGRFINLEVDTFYGHGGGLQYLNIEGHQSDSSTSSSTQLAVGLIMAFILAASVIVAVILWRRKKGCRCHAVKNTDVLSFSNLVAEVSVNAEQTTS